MLDAVLKQKRLAVRLTVKGALAVLLAVLAVALPQITHALGGALAGSKFMPMYLPVLLAGCLLGWKWGLAVGLISPLLSYAFTTVALGSAMPAIDRLPYMLLELGAYGLICGMFSNRVIKTPLLAFPAVISAQVAGRAIYVIYNLFAGRTFAELWSSVEGSLTGLYLQAIIVPLIVIALAGALSRERAAE